MTIKKIKPTIISFILDRSGSMESMKKDVIGGFNGYINKLKKSKGAKNTLFSLTTFDTMGIEKPYIAQPILKVEPLNGKNYEPRAGTPLYDAAVDSIEELAEKVASDQPALVVIMTDGEENSSSRHDEKCLSDLVEKLKMKGNWTFVFMGANQDSWANASKLGYSRNSVADFDFSSKGIQNAFRNLGESSGVYMCAMASGGGGAGGGTLNRNDSFFEGTSGSKTGGES
jgi:hypothetical protein